MNHIRFFRPLSATAVAVLILAMFPAIAMGAADHFVVTGPAAVTTGVGHSYTVTAMNGVTVETGYAGSVDLKDGSTVLDTYLFTGVEGGVHVFTLIPLTGASAHTVTATDGLNTGTLNVDVRAVGIATQLVVTISATAKVNVAENITVTAADDSGAPADVTYNGTIAFASSDGIATLPAAHSLAGESGTHTFVGGVKFMTSGAQTVSVSDAGSPSLSGTSGPIAVALGDQTVSITSTNPVTGNVGDTYTAVASATSGLPVTLSIDGAPNGICTIDAGTGVVSFTGPGTCQVDADQGGNANWNSATQANQQITLKNAQTIDSMSTAPVGAKVGDDYTTSAHATSALTVGIAVDPSSSTVCSKVGAVVHMDRQGTCLLNFTQAGNGSYWAAPSIPQSFGVDLGNTTTTIGTSSATTTYGDSVTFTATVAHGGALPGGTVEFSSDGSAISGQIAVTAGQAQFTINSLTATTHTITAVYSGDTNYAGSTTTPGLTQTVQPAALSVTASGGTFVHGGLVPTITPIYSGLKLGQSAPSGTPPSCSTVAVSNSPISGNPYASNCSGGSDSNYTFSFHAGSVTVTIADSTTSVSSSLLTSGYGVLVTFTATVGGPGLAPGGQVQFSSDGSTIGGLVAISSGQAEYSTSALSIGHHAITAEYFGDGNHNGSTSTAIDQVVSADGPSTTVVTSAGPSTYGDSVTFTATVSGGAGTPTGSVHFWLGGIDLGVFALTGGQAHYTTTTLSAADHSMIAVYGGDGSYTGSSSPAFHQIVGQRNLTITAGNAGMPYRGTVPTINPIYTGLQNGESAPATTPTCGTDATNTSVVGTGYITSCSGAADSNYAITYAPGVFTITRATPVLVFTSPAPSATVGGTYTPIVSTTSDATPADVTITVDAASSSVCTMTAGVVTFNTVGTCTLDANELISANWNAAVQVQQHVGVSLSVPTQIVVSAPGTATAGTPISVTVSVKDVDGNPVTTYTGTVHLTSTDGAAVLPVDYLFTGADAGVHVFITGVTLKTAATQTVTATDVATPSLHGTSGAIAVSPAAASKFLVTLGAGPVIPGASVSVAVLAQDAYNNTATGYTGTVHLTTSDAAGSVAGNYAFTGGDAGAHTFAAGATLNTPSIPGSPATQPTVTVTDTITGSITGTSGAVYCGYPGSTYTAIQPSRVLDTRATDTVNHVYNMGLQGLFVVGTVRTFQVSNAPYVDGGGAVAVPAGAIAVTGNLTITTQGASGGTISLGPRVVAAASGSDPTTEPTSINFIAYENRANNVTVGLSASGTLDAVYRGTAGKTMDLVFDVTGYFMAGLTGNRLTTVSPGRVLDTRPTGQGIIHMDPMTGGVQPFRQQQVRNVQVVGAAGTGWSSPMVPWNATAVTANVTVTMATTNGYVSFGPTMVYNPKTSTTNVNKISARDYYAPDTANGITVALNTSGNLQAVWIGGPGSSANVILDITGYFTQDGAGMAYYPIIPTRMMNSGYGGTPIRGGAQIFSSSEPQTLTLGGVGLIPSDAGGISGNVTLLTPSTAGFVYVGPSPIVWASTSTVNGTVGRGVANGFDVKLSVPSNGRIGVTWDGVPQIHTNVAHVSIDVTGYFK